MMKKILLTIVGILVGSSAFANTYCPDSLTCDIKDKNKTTCAGLATSWGMAVDPTISGLKTMPLKEIQAYSNDLYKKNKSYHLFCYYNATPNSVESFYIYSKNTGALGGNNWVPAKQNPDISKDCTPFSLTNCYTK